MKTSCVALTMALTLGVAASAHAVTPRTGTWKVTNSGAPTKDNTKGEMSVAKKGKSFVVKGFLSPSVYVKCVGANASPEDMNPGFEYLGGGGGMNKTDKTKGKSRTFSGTVKFSGRSGVVLDYTGKFTAAGKASGTVRVRFTKDPQRRCDSGQVKWSAKR